jgi:catechol 2,3-dioxygenase-like lactoylglutathione lyase family enzyme
MSGNTYQITPFMHVADFAAALRFLTETLGFAAIVNDGGYAYCEREGAGLRLLQNDDPAELGVPHRGFAYYIDVKSVETVLAQIGDRLADLPPGDVVGPVDQPYGQRELMIRAPDGNLIVFGASNST